MAPPPPLPRPSSIPWLVEEVFSTPADNLALDESLFRSADAASKRGGTAAYLRLWESNTYFVVLGVSSKLHEEVRVGACLRHGVPIVRRISGGGTVLQGPGCLSFSLVLPLDLWPELRQIERSYRAIGHTISGALGPIAGSPNLELSGSGDLTLGDRKVGGIAQKRTPRVLLHQGTILHDLDIGKVALYLEEPRKQPEYRKARSHLEFVGNIPLPPGTIRTRLATAFRARRPPASWTPPDLVPFVARYRSREWTERF